MANPILARLQGQQPVRVAVDQYGNQYQQPQQGYGNGPQQSWQPQQYQMGYSQPVMTLDDVVTKTGLTMGLMMVVAALSFLLLPDGVVGWAVGAGAGLAAFVFAIVVGFRTRIGPVAALGYGLLEGVFVGSVSKGFESYYPGIVGQAVLGTFVAAALTLGAVRVFKIRTGRRFGMILGVATLAYAVAMLANFLLSFAGVNLGLVDSLGRVSLLAVIMLGVGTVLAVLNLVQDFSFIQQGIEQGAPAEQSWRAAFGLTVTMVWLYINILRILSYLRN